MGLGTVCEVYIDPVGQRIRREFKPNAVTCSGKVTQYSAKEIDRFFEAEVYWSRRLNSIWIPKTYEVGHNYITQEYCGACLLDSSPNIPDIAEQVIEMYLFFADNNVYKRNGSLSNLTLRQGQLVAFDFKWAMHRPNGLTMELKSYDQWLSKIDPRLSKHLRRFI